MEERVTLSWLSAIEAYPFSKQQILDSSKLKEFPDDNSNFNENVRKFFKRVENTVGKEEIACYKQFFLFRKCSKEIYTAEKPGLVWEKG